MYACSAMLRPSLEGVNGRQYAYLDADSQATHDLRQLTAIPHPIPLALNPVGRMPMHIEEAEKTVIMAGASTPDADVDEQMNKRGITVLWANSIKQVSDLLSSACDRTVVITELALQDGNWRDLVERVHIIDGSIPILLVTGSSTAELWWDALECGVQDILPGQVLGSRLFDYLAEHFTTR